MEQAGASPDVARLSDEDETRLSMALASSGSARRAARHAPTCGLRGHEGGCLAITGFEGDAGRRGAPPRRAPASCCGPAAGCALGQRPGRGLAARAASRRPTCATSCSTAA